MGDNFVKETANYMSMAQGEEHLPVVSLAQKKQKLATQQEKQMQMEKRLPAIQQLEIDLGLPEDVKDSELTTIKSTMSTTVDQAKSSIRTQAIAEQEAKDAKEKEEHPEPEEKQH